MSTEGQTRPQGAAVESLVQAGEPAVDFLAERNRFAETALSLIKEYASRLEHVRSEIESILQQMSTARRDDVVDGIHIAEMRSENLLNWYNGMERSFRKLSRTVSQQLEHSVLNDAIRMELDVRLADFEGSLASTKKAVCSTRDYAHEQRR